MPVAVLLAPEAGTTERWHAVASKPVSKVFVISEVKECLWQEPRELRGSRKGERLF